MSGLKRVAIVTVCAVVLVVAGMSFAPGEVQKRAMVLGLGLDFDNRDGGVFLLTAEVVSPGNGGEQVGVFSKVISAEGRSVGEAVFHISERTGKEPSLGQCGVLVLGRSLFAARDFTDVVDYFAYSDSFKETAVVCCADDAGKLFGCLDVLNKSVSLALVQTLRERYKDIALPSDTLLRFARSQAELTRTGYLNYAEFVPTNNTDEQATDKENGYFTYGKTAVFRSGKFVAELSGEEQSGFALLDEAVTGSTMSVKHDGKTYALRVNGKKVDKTYRDGEIDLKVTLQVKLARADSADVGGDFSAKNDEQIPQEMLEIFRADAESRIRAFVDKQRAYNFDIAGFHELMRRKYGTNETTCNLPMSDLKVNLTVGVTEK